MTERQTLKVLEKLRKQALKDFGKTSCGEMTMDCSSCQGQVLIGYLNWYSDILEFPTLKKEVKVAKKK